MIISLESFRRWRDGRYEWRIWFAWRPVLVGCWPERELAWLCRVERRVELSYGWDPDPYWAYRRIQK